MKNRKSAKLVSLIIALAALITCMVAMNVSAETATPELKSINLIYGDQIQIMVGTNIPTSEALGDLKVAYYKQNPAENPDAQVFYATALPADSKYNYKVGDTAYWTFYTDGIPASAVSAERFVTIFNGDTVPADATYKTYSVMEYLFERLYRMDYISKKDGTVDGNKKNLYLNMIDYTAFAQQVLVNDNPDIAEDIRLITEYKYVYAKGCKINGGGSSLILTEDSDVTLTLNDGTDSTDLTGWVVYTYGADGALLAAAPATTNTVSVKTHTVIAPVVVDCIDFEDWEIGEVSADSHERVESYHQAEASSGGWKEGLTSEYQIVDVDGNKKLQFDGTGYDHNYNYLNFSANTTSEDANVTVFEVDIEYLSIKRKGNRKVGYFDFCIGDDIKMDFMLYEDGGKVRPWADLPYFFPQAMDYEYAAGAKQPFIYTGTKEYCDANPGGGYEYKFTIKIEYYHSVTKADGTKTGMVKFYCDGANLGDVEAAELTENITSLRFQGAERNSSAHYYIDNLRIENTNMKYTPWAPAEPEPVEPDCIDFEDWTEGDVSAESHERVESYYQNNDTAGGWGVGLASDYQIVNVDSNKKLQFNGTGNVHNYNYINFSAKTNSDNANVTVFEVDIDYLSFTTAGGRYMGYFDFYIGDAKKLGFTLYSYDGKVTIYDQVTGFEPKDMDYEYASAIKHPYIYTGTKDYCEKNSTDEKVYEYKFTLKIEYYHSVDAGDGTKTGMVKYYIDGANIGDVQAAELTENVTSLRFQGAHRQATAHYYIDNLRFENTNMTYTPYAPAE